jgi:hypothetical protein
MYWRVLFLSCPSAIYFAISCGKTYLLALTGDEIELEVGHQEPSSWEYPFRTLMVLQDQLFPYVYPLLVLCFQEQRRRETQ